MDNVTLKSEIPADLYNKFYTAATDKKGRWRGEQSAEKALQTAVHAALLYFLDSLEKPDLAQKMLNTLMRD